MARNILIVDDDQDFCYSAGIALRMAGYKIASVSSGHEALSILRSGRRVRFDLLLLDVIMPEMSGIEVIEEMNKIGNPLPVLVISGLADEHLVTELRNMGCADFLDKPFEPREMVRRVANILERTDPRKKGS